MMDELLLKFETYLREEGKAESTIDTYLNNIKLFFTWYKETNDEVPQPDLVTTLDIQDFRNHLINILKQSPSTINKKIVTLKAFWGFALDTGISTLDPTRKIKLKRTSVQNMAPKWLDRREQSKFLHQVEKEENETLRVRNLAIVHLMLSAGLRVEETVNLSVPDVDVTNRIITVRSGKGDKYRIVFFQRAVQEHLRNWMAIRKASDSNQFLFPSSRPAKGADRSLTTRSIMLFVTGYGSAAGIEDMSCHRLRHSFCKNLIDAGNPLEYVAQLAGHESIETTRRYTTPSERDLRKAIDSIEQ